jgi:DNA modification methylase
MCMRSWSKNSMIKPDYEDANLGIEMYQGDSITILPQLIEKYKGEVNAVLTDPPYGIAYVSNHRTDKDLLGQAIKNDEDLDVVERVVPMLDELLANNSALYFFAHPNMVGENRKIFDKYWTYKNLLVWDKGDAGTFGDLEAAYSLNYESVFYYNKGRKKLNGSRPRTILRHDGSTTGRKISEIDSDEYLTVIGTLLYTLPDDLRNRILEELPEDIVRLALSEHPKARLRKDWSSRNDPVHPTVKPIPLLSTLLKNSTKEGDLVIDCFMGSGTAAAACKALGRRFIGIELRPEFFNIAINRVNKQTLFDVPAPPPVQQMMWGLEDLK